MTENIYTQMNSKLVWYCKIQYYWTSRIFLRFAQWGSLRPRLVERKIGVWRLNVIWRHNCRRNTSEANDVTKLSNV